MLNGMGIEHLKLVFGISQGGMQTWLWVSAPQTRWMRSCRWAAYQRRSAAGTCCGASEVVPSNFGDHLTASGGEWTGAVAQLR